MEAIRESRISFPLAILCTVITSYQRYLTSAQRVQKIYPCRYSEMAINSEDLADIDFLLAPGRGWKLPVQGVQDQLPMTNTVQDILNEEGVAAKRNLGVEMLRAAVIMKYHNLSS